MLHPRIVALKLGMGHFRFQTRIHPMILHNALYIFPVQNDAAW